MIVLPLIVLLTFSLIKMLYWVVRKNCEAADDPATDFYLTESQLVQAVRRNFGGSDEFDPLDEFQDCLQSDILEEVLTYSSHECISHTTISSKSSTPTSLWTASHAHTILVCPSHHFTYNIIYLLVLLKPPVSMVHFLSLTYTFSCLTTLCHYIIIT